MEFIDRAASLAQATFLEGICRTVSATTDVWGPECDIETVFMPENAWLQAVIGIVVMNIFVHYCWMLEIACTADAERKQAMAKWWLFSAFLSTGLAHLVPGPNTPTGFFFVLENLYVPIVLKVVEYNSLLFF